MKSFGPEFNNGFPVAIARSFSSRSLASASASCLAFSAARSAFIFASSAYNAAVSSSSSDSEESLLLDLNRGGLYLSSESSSSDSASISLASSRIFRRFAVSSSSSSPFSSNRFSPRFVSSSFGAASIDPPFPVFRRCSASAARSSARRSRCATSAWDVCPSCRSFNCVCAGSDLAWNALVGA